MKLQTGFTDVFMSPVTGRRVLSGLPSLPEDYTWVGDRTNRPIPSPILIDLRLDIIELNSRLAETHFILQTASEGFYNSQSLDQLRNGILRHEQGVVKIATLPENNIWIGDADENPVPSATIPMGSLPDLQNTYVWLGDITNRPVAYQHIEIDNLPDLGFNNIWRGDIFGRPVESGVLTTIETSIATLQFELGALQTQVGTLATTVAGLVSTVAGINAALGVIGTTLAGIATSLTSLQNQIKDTKTRIDNLRLNNIPIDGDIDMQGYRITNLPCDPIYDLEPTTLCFIWHLMHDEVNIEWP
jgi:hypothetical protein